MEGTEQPYKLRTIFEYFFHHLLSYPMALEPKYKPYMILLSKPMYMALAYFNAKRFL